jgi:3-methylcrotonyl-CoA carboxylase alpha subunit
MPNSVLIANRGEIACRVIAACRSLGWRSMAVFAEGDETALHVQLADESVPLPGATARQTYANPAALLAAARTAGANFVHPGYGFLSENGAFARDVVAAGLIWVGADPATIDEMGDKGRARALAAAAGVPVLPGSPRLMPGDTVEPAWVERVGYPLLVKASGGGGGMGMRVVAQPADLLAALKAVQTQAARLFDDPAVLVERYVQNARHIEIQVFGFGDGRAVHLFERDCSIQRRFQKIIEETAAPNLPEATRRAMCAAALSLACSRRYAGAGTVEFLYDRDDDRFYFLEMNTRIQVEHPVTEMATGVDLVQLQLRLAAGDDLAELQQDLIVTGRHAIEFRLCAEDPAKAFRPSPGVLTALTLPKPEAGIRVDTGFREGDLVSPYYDSLIAKIICSGDTRADALARARGALARVHVEGPVTNIDLLRKICDNPVFVAGAQTTAFLQDNPAIFLAADA